MQASFVNKDWSVYGWFILLYWLLGSKPIYFVFSGLF